jgi:hypothetical protein
MSGKIRLTIDAIFAERAGKSSLIRDVIETKLILKGINPQRYTLESEDDPVILEKLENVIKDLESKNIKKV